MTSSYAKDHLKKAVLAKLGHADNFGCQSKSKADDCCLSRRVDVNTAEVHGTIKPL